MAIAHDAKFLITTVSHLKRPRLTIILIPTTSIKIMVLSPQFRPHDSPGDDLPGADQHLQHHHERLAQRGGDDRHRVLDDRLHPLCFWRATRIRRPPLLFAGTSTCPITSRISRGSLQNKKGQALKIPKFQDFF